MRNCQICKTEITDSFTEVVTTCPNCHRQSYRPLPKYAYAYPRPMVTVDLVVFAPDKKGDWHVLLIRRGKDPFGGKLAIPGGFLNDNEASVDAACRELREETGYITNHKPAFLGVYDKPERDPRGRVITLAYVTSLPQIVDVKGADDAAEALWVRTHEATGLAFDHDDIMIDACGWLYQTVICRTVTPGCNQTADMDY